MIVMYSTFVISYKKEATSIEPLGTLDILPLDPLTPLSISVPLPKRRERFGPVSAHLRLLQTLRPLPLDSLKPLSIYSHYS